MDNTVTDAWSVFSWRVEAKTHGMYAIVTWAAEDVGELRPDWSEERCLEFLQANQKYIVESMVEQGWIAMEALLPSE